MRQYKDVFLLILELLFLIFSNWNHQFANLGSQTLRFNNFEAISVVLSILKHEDVILLLLKAENLYIFQLLNKKRQTGLFL